MWRGASQASAGTEPPVSRYRPVDHHDNDCMPRFFFHVHNGHGEIPDDTGTELADNSAASRLAIDSVRSMVSEDARRGLIDLKGRVDVKDDSDNLLISVDFIEAFDLRLP